MLRKPIVFFVACVLCLGIVSINLVRIQAAPESPNQVFSLPWWTVDSGGGSSQGEAYSLSGTIGQADAGRLSGGSYTLEGGFWSSAAQTPLPTPTPTDTPIVDYTTFLPIIIH